MQGVKWEDNPNLARWFNDISEAGGEGRNHQSRCHQVELRTATEDQKDRFFNRGRYARA